MQCIQSQTAFAGRLTLAHGTAAAAAAYWPALPAPTNADVDANSAFYKYLSPDLFRSLSFSPSSPLQPPRPRARYSRTALISALQPSARPPLRLAIPRRHPVRILSAFSFPNRSSRLIVSFRWCVRPCGMQTLGCWASQTRAIGKRRNPKSKAILQWFSVPRGTCLIASTTFIYSVGFGFSLP